MANEVIFKGIRDGLVVLLPDGPVERALDRMLEKMDQNRPFFEGGNCPVYISGDLSDELLGELRELLGKQFGIRSVERANQPRQAEARGQTSVPAAACVASPGRENLGLTVEGTIRNGQRITYQGDIIVLGDCNPGSQLIAGGNIIVLGNLRGVAHAGALGDEGASIAAFILMPTQIRIASFIARPPEGAKKPDIPQVARIRDGRVEISNLTVKPLPGGIL